jgi:hypothetical protein
VDVDTAQHRRIEEALGQDVAIGDDDGGVEIECPEGLGLLVAPETARCANGKAELGGELVHRRPAFLLAAAGGLGRARVDQDDVVTGVDQCTQRRHGESGGSEERDLHRRTL